MWGLSKKSVISSLFFPISIKNFVRLQNLKRYFYNLWKYSKSQLVKFRIPNTYLISEISLSEPRYFNCCLITYKLNLFANNSESIYLKSPLNRNLNTTLIPINRYLSINAQTVLVASVNRSIQRPPAQSKSFAQSTLRFAVRHKFVNFMIYWWRWLVLTSAPTNSQNPHLPPALSTLLCNLCQSVLLWQL